VWRSERTQSLKPTNLHKSHRESGRERIAGIRGSHKEQELPWVIHTDKEETQGKQNQDQLDH